MPRMHRSLSPKTRSESSGLEQVKSLDSAHAKEIPRSHKTQTTGHFGPPALLSIEVFGSSISPPTSLCSPPEFVYQHVIDPQLGDEVQRAYAISRLRESLRRDKYGTEVANRWKRGFTPEEARQEWKLTAARQRAQAEEYSDSD